MIAYSLRSICYPFFALHEWGKSMDNLYMNFLQNAFTDMFDTGTQLKKMDKIVEQSLSSFEEFTSMINKFGYLESFFTPINPSLFDFKKSYDEYLKTMGMISIDEYRSLVNKYEELKKENQNAEKIRKELDKKNADLNQALSNEKKKLTARNKTDGDNKSKQDELKKLADSLKKDLVDEKKQTQSLKQELDEIKKLVDAMKKEINQKEKLIKKTETSKA